MKVAVAMSGGVDSSVAVKLLLDQGYEVFGITMFIQKYFPKTVVNDAKEVAEKLSIKHYSFDLSEKFNKEVIDYFTGEYLKGRTPNPCVMCNPEIKFGSLLEEAEKLGAAFIATGHYAVINQDPSTKRFRIKNADNEKDQSYFLWKLSQDQLSKTLFPLINLNKSEIRKIASNIGLTIAEKPDSQDICFISDEDYRAFLDQNIPERINKIGKGDYINKGKIVGKHSGYYNYTIGQRRGLGIALGERAFVTKIDPKNNIVELGSKEDLQSKIVTADNLNFISVGKFNIGDIIYGKIRFNNKSEKAVVKNISENEITVEFDKPKTGVTPGQSLVMYDEDGYILAGGVIKS